MRMSRGLQFAVVNKYAYLCGIGSCKDEHIFVPSHYNGYCVAGVLAKSFRHSEQIKSITLPSSVTLIEEESFAWCSNLEYVMLNRVQKICQRAFIGCDKLSKIKFGGKLNQIGEKAFAYCPSLNSPSFPRSLNSIDTSAFEGCRNIDRITLPKGIEIIKNGTFYACSNLQHVKLPENLKYIDEYAFAYCAAIKEININQKTVLNRDAFYECSTIHCNVS